MITLDAIGYVKNGFKAKVSAARIGYLAMLDEYFEADDLREILWKKEDRRSFIEAMTSDFLIKRLDKGRYLKMTDFFSFISQDRVIEINPSINMMQMAVLEYVTKNEGCTISQIAHFFDKEETSLFNPLASLERFGFIDVHREETGRRLKTHYPSKKLKELILSQTVNRTACKVKS